MAIVILSFNHPEITARCVRSCLNLYNEKKILLIHNGSTDKHRLELEGLFPQIQHHSMTVNRGYSGGVNFGLNKAFEVCNWALLVTNDCELLKFQSLPQAPGLYAPHILKRKTLHTDSLGGQVNLKTGHLIHNKNLNQNIGYVPGTAFLIHKDIFVAGFSMDESLDTYWEDVDFSLRVAKAGHYLASFDQIQLRHGIGKTCHKLPHYSTYLYQRNRGRVCRRHSQGMSRLFFEFFYLKDILKRSILFAFRNKASQSRLILLAYKDSWSANYLYTRSAAVTAS